MNSETLLKPPVAKRKGIFPGYSLVTAGAIMIFWAAGTQAYGFAVYVKELIKTFGWSRAQVALASSFGRFEGGLEAPLSGIVIDKWGPRVANLGAVVILSLGFGLMYFVNNLWQFYVAWITTSVGWNLGFAHALDTAVANWFVRRRGLMVGFMRGVVALSGLIITLSTWLLYQFGWRQAFLILSVATLLIGLPLTWFYVRAKRPEYYGWLPDGRRLREEVATGADATIMAGVEYATEATGEVEFTVRQALKDKIWWICVLSTSLRGVSNPVVNVHLIPHLTDIGFDPMLAAAAFSMLLFMTLPGRIGFGWWGDRIRLTRIKYLVIASALIEALGLFLIVKAANIAWLWVAMAIYGLGQGGGATVWVPLRGRYWGRKAYGTIQGAMSPFTMIAGIAAPVYAGWAYDTTGSYMTALSVVAIAVVVSAVIMFFANPPKPPEKIGKITDVV